MWLASRVSSKRKPLVLIISLLRSRAKYCNERVCVYVSFCLSVREHIAQSTRAIFTIFVHVAYFHGSVLLRRGDKIPRRGGNLGFFFYPIDSAWYSIAFRTNTKTAEPIEMPFGLITRVGPRYHVLDGDPFLQGKGAFFWGGNVAAHCKVMRHSTVRCAKTAEPIVMPFWMKTRVSPRNRVLDGGADPQK